MDNVRVFPLLWRLGWASLDKQRRGMMFGWFWLFYRPIVYTTVFGAALIVGFRQSHPTGSTTPYLYWLACGLLPWFFISAMLGPGASAFRARKDLIKQNVVPLTTIPSVLAMPGFIIFILSFCGLIVIGLFFGVFPKIYWIQMPLLFLLAFVFFYFFSLFASCFSALSKDFFSFIRALSMPTFWLSGVLFDVSHIKSTLFQGFLAVNPVTFLVRSFRIAMCESRWFFTDLETLLPFLAVLAFTMIFACYNYHFLKSEVRDALWTT